MSSVAWRLSLSCRFLNYNSLDMIFFRVFNVWDLLHFLNQQVYVSNRFWKHFAFILQIVPSALSFSKVTVIGALNTLVFPYGGWECVCLWSSALFNLCTVFRQPELLCLQTLWSSLSVTLTNCFHSNCIFFFTSRCDLTACVRSCVGMNECEDPHRTSSSVAHFIFWDKVSCWTWSWLICLVGLGSCGSCIGGICLLVDTGLFPWGLISWDRSGGCLGDTHGKGGLP